MAILKSIAGAGRTPAGVHAANLDTEEYDGEVLFASSSGIDMYAIATYDDELVIHYHAAPVGRAVTRLQSSMAVAAILATVVPPERLLAVATRIVPGLGRAWQTVEPLIARIIDARTGAPHDEPSDLLDLLLAAGQDEQPLSRAEIQDEVMTLVLVGHETTANALTWALTLLSRYPAAYERLVAEVEDVLGGRDPQGPDVDALPWAQAVVLETMRLYPPVWHVERDAVQDDDLSGVPVSAGDTVGFSPYLLHHHPEFWPNPERFDPQRFLLDSASTRPRYAYLPFGGGRRICVGAGLAQLEVTLALAVISQSARVDLVPTAPLRARADVTLHPSGPVVATVTPARPRQRSTAGSGFAEAVKTIQGGLLDVDALADHVGGDAGVAQSQCQRIR